MIQFEIITIFPELFTSYLKESLIARALKKKLVKINVHNLRDWTWDKHKTVDDRPFGGGFGMVMKAEPVYKAVASLKKTKANNRKSKVVLFTPRGKKFNQKIAYQLSKSDQVIFICGRYEGVDERIAKNVADLELSIGDYVLMGGELPAMVAIETISRLVPGVLGKEGLLRERITKEKGFIEYAQYTRPEVFSPKKGVSWRVPKVLLSGDHKKIEAWKKKHGKAIES
jgi:tRNA (guanine37-N1)-methyltransferase